MDGLIQVMCGKNEIILNVKNEVSKSIGVDKKLEFMTANLFLGLDSQLRNIMSNEIKSVIAAENASVDEQDEETDLNVSKLSEDDIMT